MAVARVLLGARQGGAVQRLNQVRRHTTTTAPLVLTKEHRDLDLEKKNLVVRPMLQGGHGGDPLAVIEWAAKEFDGRVAMSTSMGLQAAVLLHMATRILPNIPVVWVDTGYLPKETYTYAEELKQVLGLNLIVSANSQWSAARLESIHGKLWEKEDVDSHTLYGKLTKVDPLAAGLASIQPSPLALLSGLRAGQTKARASMEPVGFSQGRYKLLPMLKMSDADVVEYMDKYDLPKHPLQAKGYATVGDWHSSRPVQAGEDARATRFGGKFEECGLHVDSHDPVPNDASKAKTADAPSQATAVAATAQAKKPQLPLPSGLESLGFVSIHEDTDLAVIMVKKKMLDGTWCRKCNDVAQKMEEDGVDKWIGHIAVADVQDGHSEGVKLATRFEVATAPFFLVRNKDEQNAGENWRVVRSYLQMRKMLQDAHVAKKARIGGDVLQEDPRIVEHRRHAEELKAQIDLLSARLKEVEEKMLEVAAVDVPAVSEA
jgi:phosphoadenosine phosphosulfate reductase